MSGTHVTQRREVAGAVGVVLQQQRVKVRKPLECLTRDGLVAAAGRPDAAWSVTATHVQRARDALDALEQGAIDLGVDDHFGFQVVPVGFQRGAHVRVDVELAIVRRVQLEVVAAELQKRFDHMLAQVVAHGNQEVIHRRIRPARIVRMPEDTVIAWRGKRVLGPRVRVRLEKRVFARHQIALDAQGLGDESARSIHAADDLSGVVAPERHKTGAGRLAIVEAAQRRFANGILDDVDGAHP